MDQMWVVRENKALAMTYGMCGNKEIWKENKCGGCVWGAGSNMLRCKCLRHIKEKVP